MEFANGGGKALKKAIADLGTEEGRKRMDFKSPYHWARFTLVGDGSLMLR